MKRLLQKDDGSSDVKYEMNYPAAEQRGIYKGNETPQAAGN